MSDQLSYFIRLSSVLEAMPDALVIVDKNGRIVLINKQTEKLFGYERSELLGEYIEQLMPERYRERHQHYRDGYFENPRVRSMGEGFELFGLTKSGNEFPVEISLSPLKTDEGVFTLSAIRDITIRKKADAKFRSIVEAAPDCLLIINGEGSIVLANNLLEKTFGYSKNEVLGKSVEMLIPERYRGNHIGHRQHYFNKPRVRGMGEGMELYGLHKDGYEFPVEISLSPLDTEEGQLALAAVRNITERKKLEQELRIKNNELQIQNLRVQEATKLKSAFLANMSHELRTPLNIIIGFTELMHSEKVGPISTQHKEFLNDILTSSHHLLQLINDILDLSKIESGKMEFFPQQVETKKIFS
jgi:PAS domain S-box-containing protein